MKLSVLIPTFNYDCRTLVSQLLKQLPTDAEIIVGDDCSTNIILQAYNREIATWQQCRIFESKKNVGRSRIRNQLAQIALGEWILFIDADAAVHHPDYIQQYLKDTATHDVICGGTGNLPTCPSPEVILRYKYEIKAEERLSIEYKRKNPYAQFTTFNFMIRRAIFLQVQFNENCHEYGHEDTLFGLDLKKKGIPIYHIDNKLIHLGLEPADEYIRKTETALRTLAKMDDDMKEHARISNLANRLHKYHLCPIVKVFHATFKSIVLHNIHSRKPSLLLFNLYKLGYYITISD